MPDQNDGSGAGGNEGAEQKQEGEQKKEEGKEKVDKKPEDQIPEPPVRKTPKDFIIQRKQEKIDKLENKNKEEDEDEEGEELTAKGKKALEKAIDDRFGPMEDAMRETADEGEVGRILMDKENYPFAKRLESGIRKYMRHSAYQGVGIDFIYHGLVGKLGLSESEKKEADEEASASDAGGHSNRPKEKSEKLPDFRAMSDEQFLKWEKEHNQ